MKEEWFEQLSRKVENAQLKANERAVRDAGLPFVETAQFVGRSRK
jgi:hypothetical protein